MLISIIIPVYNAEKYLTKCLESVKNQTHQDLEVILVNDGSTDQSSSICNEYAQKDKRFNVIHKKNGGVSSARNEGLKVAKGEYIGFIDPDDWVEGCMFEKLYQLAIENNADISMCGYYKEKVDGTVLNNIINSPVIELTPIESINNILNKNDYRGFLWNKLFSADILKKTPVVDFNNEIHFCEDLLFCCQSILKCGSIVFDSTPYYHYIIHDNNASQSYFSPKKLTSLVALEKIIELLNDEKDIEIKKFKNYYMHMNISLLMNGIYERKCKNEDRKRLKKNLFRFKLNDLTEKNIKFSCAITRVNIILFYFFWKTVNKSYLMNKTR
ncbi:MULTISPECIES: glycosyltransferase [unclassified Bacillus (in: firmicutes)]|uniref:glycosyltransferase family 2 protein n=1 Tax=unclassified Bacillus (in: firmicutes) TaxID=185979 RepID=UPI001BECC57E|nr:MULTISPECIES: glycosyltransferase [unclassified Bacillus (in: firmicutes)]MBT2616776.1 glycosyltransferase [Bacillus sp. ISL-78]MBT2631494.1 glycosyltransferase [Bacillus sp. ISL-101]